MNEIQQNGIGAADSTQHYWIKKKPEDETEIPWIEAIVAHLGIRVVWLDDWDQSALALEKLLGIAPKKLCLNKGVRDKRKKGAKRIVSTTRKGLYKKPK